MCVFVWVGGCALEGRDSVFASPLALFVRRKHRVGMRVDGSDPLIHICLCACGWRGIMKELTADRRHRVARNYRKVTRVVHQQLASFPKQKAKTTKHDIRTSHRHTPMPAFSPPHATCYRHLSLSFPAPLSPPSEDKNSPPPFLSHLLPQPQKVHQIVHCSFFFLCCRWWLKLRWMAQTIMGGGRERGRSCNSLKVPLPLWKRD
jgi:hypothetical protein